MRISGRFLSTLPARGATGRIRERALTQAISIHAPREGSDKRCGANERAGSFISIHAPREGSDARPAASSTSLMLFLSTLPARGATGRFAGWLASPWHFYPRSPRGERHGAPCCRVRPCNFYPRSPRGERPARHSAVVPTLWISIHAPREGSDRPRGGDCP